MLKWLAVASLGTLLAVAMLAWWVLESSGVAIVETQPPDGGVRRTHVWYAEVDGVIWLEAGHPENPWYRDIQTNPSLTLHTDSSTGHFRAATVAGRSAHDQVRALLSEKYGLRDRILDWVIDTSPSIAVRLTPVGGGDEPASDR